MGGMGAVGTYVTSDFPVHSPGPGDENYVMATLGQYVGEDEISPMGPSFYGRGDISAMGDAYGQQGIFSVGAAWPPGGYHSLGAGSTPELERS